jgi:hypothetical protein
MEMFEEGEAELWWAGKQMEQVNIFPVLFPEVRDAFNCGRRHGISNLFLLLRQGQEKKLSDYIGNNDKTKIIAKLQRKGAGAQLHQHYRIAKVLRMLILPIHARCATARAGGGREDAKGNDGHVAQEAGHHPE